jgi:hypothetical protein
VVGLIGPDGSKTLLSRYRLMDTFDMALVGHIIYWYSVTNYGRPSSLAKPVWCVVIWLVSAAAHPYSYIRRSLIVRHRSVSSHSILT